MFWIKFFGPYPLINELAIKCQLKLDKFVLFLFLIIYLFIYFFSKY